MRYILGILFLVLASPSTAQAACSSPAGNAGDQMYNSTHNVMQFCDGTDWTAMKDGGSTAETDPQVSAVTSGQWCRGTGSAVSCDQATPGIPSGAVMAFALTSCPSGWSEYTLARGRFIRGRCTTASGCQDPDGVRSTGSVQNDAYRSHNHSYTRPGSTDEADGGDGQTIARGSSGSSTGSSGSTETRPKNVALLYCVKS